MSNKNVIKIGITGSINFYDYEFFQLWMRYCFNQWNINSKHQITIITGDGKGIEELARRFANDHKYKLNIYIYEWNRYGRLSGPMRNNKIIDTCSHISVLPSQIKTKTGPHDLISKSLKNNIPIEIRYVD